MLRDLHHEENVPPCMLTESRRTSLRAPSKVRASEHLEALLGEAGVSIKLSKGTFVSRPRHPAQYRWCKALT